MENLVLKPLTDEEIEQLGLSVSDLWMIQGEGQDVQGPFSTSYLNEKAKEHESFFETTMVFNLVIEEWRDFFSSAEFQRRKPKLVPAQNLIQNEDFYLLDKGQKTGPYKLEEVKAKVESKEIQVSDEVSVDDGKTWIKLYEHHEFDRRLMKNQEDLPFQPEADVFEESDKVASLEVARAQKLKEDESAITGLAFIGRGHDKGQELKNSNDKKETSEEEYEENDLIDFKLPQSQLTNKIKAIKWKYVGGFFIFFLMSFGLFNTFNNKFNSNFEASVEKKEKSSRKAINNTDRSVATKKVPRKQPTKRIQAKRTQPKRYEPKRAPAKAAKKPRYMKIREKVTHSYEDYENIDIDDPRVRDALTRELAGEYEEENDYYDDRDKDVRDVRDEYSNQNDYVDDYEHERQQMENADYGNDNYPENNYDNQQYNDSDPNYNEVSDFE